MVVVENKMTGISTRPVAYGQRFSSSNIIVEVVVAVGPSFPHHQPTASY
jgi:hypothetical protein